MKKMKINTLGLKMVCYTSLISLSSFTYASDDLAQPSQARQPSSQINNTQIDHGFKNHRIDNNRAPSLQKHDYPQNKVNKTASAVAVACNTNAYATSGNALLNTIKSQGIACLDGLFGAVPNGAFTEANILTVANEARARGAAYNGVDTDDYLTSLHYWIRAFYYEGNRANLTTANQTATKQAMDALFANSHFYDKTAGHAKLIDFAVPNINSASIAEKYVTTVRNLLQRYDKSYEDVPKWGNALANITWNVLNECSRQPTCRATEHTTTLINELSNFIHNNVSWLDHPERDYHLHNVGYQLAHMHSGKSDAHFANIKTTLEAKVNRIFTDFGYTKDSVGRKAYMLAMSAVNYNQVCATYNLCSKKDEIITAVLKDRITCPSGTLFLWAQDMNQAQRDWACSSLVEHENYFHSKMQTNNTPVTPDDNEKLRMIVFNDSTEWSVYGGALFGASTDNGGLYLEGDPSKAGDQATFFAYEDVPARPTFDIWNLRHEYMHYLDGRFNTQGDFGDVNANGTGKTVWYGEGIAEFISRKNCNPEAATAAAASTYDISTIFENEYGVGQTRIYPWGYLASRYMFEQQNATFFQMVNKFRQGDYTSYKSTMVDNWVNSQTFNNGFKAWLPSVTSSGCVVDTTRPPSPIEPLDLDDVQGTDQVGINACVGGVAREDSELKPGIASCIKDASGNQFVSLGISVKSGIVADMQVTLRNGSGGNTMQHKFDAHPKDTDYDHIAQANGADQTILVKNVKAGWNYVRVIANPGFNNVTALARFLPTDGTGPGNQAPTANAGGTYAGAVNESISMSSNGSSDSDGNIVSYSWNFGDGSATSAVANPTHSYATAGTYTVTLTVTDNEGASASTSTTATIGTVIPPVDYCTVTGGGTHEWIAGVAVGDLNNASTQDSYKDNTNLTANLTTGANSITLTPGFSSGSYTEHWAVWIDYNKDGDFTDAGENVVSGVNGKTAVTASFTPPSSASGVTTRMRVAMKYNQAVTAPCTNIASGEVEDYTVTIAGGIDNVAPTANANGAYSADAGMAISMSSAGSTDSDGTIASYSWNFGDGTATSTGANPSHTYTTAGNYTVTLIVTDNDGATDTSTTTATINAVGGATYCSVTGGGTYEWIAGVAVGGLNNTSTQDNYKDNTHLTANLTAGANSITLTPGYDNGTYTEHWAVWIDYNGDGDFVDAGENVVSGVSGKGAVTATITPPASALGVTTRMRVAMKYNQAVTAPCTNIASGEVEDYTVTISGSTGGNNSAPVANTDGPYTGLEGTGVAMSSNGSSDSDGSIVGYSWNFGDGTALSTSANPNHTYASAGNYTVTLTVTDDDNATSSTTTTATISGSGTVGGDIVNACSTEAPFTGQNLTAADAICVPTSTSSTGVSYLYIQVPANTNSLSVKLAHGTGNADLYYDASTWATTTNNTLQSTGSGNTESITVNNPAQQYHFIGVTGAHSGATLLVEFN